MIKISALKMSVYFKERWNKERVHTIIESYNCHLLKYFIKMGNEIQKDFLLAKTLSFLFRDKLLE